MSALDSILAKGQRNDPAGEALSIAGDGIDRPGRQFAENSQALNQFHEFPEMLLDDAIQFALIGWQNQGPCLAQVELPQLGDSRQRLIAPSSDCLAANGKQLVRGPSHGRNHDDGPAVQARLDDRGDSVGGGRRLPRRAPQFHYPPQLTTPPERIPSALRTAAPAAPRIVLWPR